MGNFKFLVIQQKMLGDVLASSVICECLKSIYPECTIDFVANRNTTVVLNNNPNLDKIIVFEQKYRASKWEFYRFLRSLRKEHYHAVIDAYGKLESNLISLFCKAKFKVSHRKWYTKWIYTHTVDENLNPNGKMPLAYQNRLQLLNPIIGSTNTYVTYPKIYLAAEEIKHAREMASQLKGHEYQHLIMISILGSSDLKSFPAEFMAAVLDIICSKTSARLVTNYLPGQKEQVMAIYNKCKKETQSRIAIDFYADDLRQFLGILSQCGALIGNEGGAVNMAKALDVPTFCLFSPFILKGAWHVDSSDKDIGIHLKDYKPELFENIDLKELKKNSERLYREFEPGLFKESLEAFLGRNFDRINK